MILVFGLGTRRAMQRAVLRPDEVVLDVRKMIWMRCSHVDSVLPAMPPPMIAMSMSYG